MHTFHGLIQTCNLWVRICGYGLPHAKKKFDILKRSAFTILRFNFDELQQVSLEIKSR